MDYAKESLKMHYELKGKIEIAARTKANDRQSLSLAYTPGVAEPCLEIQKDVNKSYELTRRWNTVAVANNESLGTVGLDALEITVYGIQAGHDVYHAVVGKPCLIDINAAGSGLIVILAHHSGKWF